MESRIKFIDALKGFAILLVVMGHTITYMYSQPYEQMLSEYPKVTMFWWKLIYSFHMPLFMFISGYLFCRENGYSVQSGLKTLWKRTYTLLLPFISWILITRYVFQTPKELWFLRSLFTFIVIALSWELIRRYIQPKWLSILSDLLVYAGSYVALIRIVHLLPMNIQTMLDLRPTMWLFFCFGILFRRYNVQRVLQQKWIFTLALSSFLILFYCHFTGLTYLPLQNIWLSLSAVVAVWCLFTSQANGDTKWGGVSCSYRAIHIRNIYIAQLF